jgi:hypothetical protein
VNLNSRLWANVCGCVPFARCQRQPEAATESGLARRGGAVGQLALVALRTSEALSRTSSSLRVLFLRKGWHDGGRRLSSPLKGLEAVSFFCANTRSLPRHCTRAACPTNPAADRFRSESERITTTSTSGTALCHE